MKYDHYNQILDENKNYIWYINSEGFIFKRSKKTNEDYYLKGYMKNGFLTIKVNFKEHRFKNLVAQFFHKEWFPGCLVGLKDGNQNNISITNLYIYSKKCHGKRTGYLSNSKPVIIIENGLIFKYRSVREAAKSLYVSYQTLSDYLNNSFESSVLDKEDRIIRYA